MRSAEEWMGEGRELIQTPLPIQNNVMIPLKKLSDYWFLG